MPNTTGEPDDEISVLRETIANSRMVEHKAYERHRLALIEALGPYAGPEGSLIDHITTDVTNLRELALVVAHPMTPNTEGGMRFGEALLALLAHKRVTRRAWSTGTRWLVLVPGSNITITEDRPLGIAAPELIGTTGVQYGAHIDIVTNSTEGYGLTIAPWCAPSGDLLANDWLIIPAAEPRSVFPPGSTRPARD